tara:strand:- start:531 stop:764 length:234 start_codon:yes stop_codon:yes gene_type:complete
MKITKQRLREIIKEEIGLGAVTEEEEPDMRTPAERYGKSQTEIGVLEELDGAIREAVQYVAIENLRDFLNDALKNIL